VGIPRRAEPPLCCFWPWNAVKQVEPALGHADRRGLNKLSSYAGSNTLLPLLSASLLRYATAWWSRFEDSGARRPAVVQQRVRVLFAAGSTNQAESSRGSLPVPIVDSGVCGAPSVGFAATHGGELCSSGSGQARRLLQQWLALVEGGRYWTHARPMALSRLPVNQPAGSRCST